MKYCIRYRYIAIWFYVCALCVVCVCVMCMPRVCSVAKREEDETNGITLLCISYILYICIKYGGNGMNELCRQCDKCRKIYVHVSSLLPFICCLLLLLYFQR